MSVVGLMVAVLVEESGEEGVVGVVFLGDGRVVDDVVSISFSSSLSSESDCSFFFLIMSVTMYVVCGFLCTLIKYAVVKGLNHDRMTLYRHV